MAIDRESKILGKTVVSSYQTESWAEIEFDDGTVLRINARIAGNDNIGRWPALDIEVEDSE